MITRTPCDNNPIYIIERIADVFDVGDELSERQAKKLHALLKRFELAVIADAIAEPEAFTAILANETPRETAQEVSDDMLL